MISSEKKSAGPTCLAALMRIVRRSGSEIGLESSSLPIGEMTIAVFDHDDRSIDEHSNRQSNSAERHDVRGHAQPVHRDERHKNRNGQGKNRDQRGTKMEEEDDDHQADDDRFFQKIALQRFDRCIDQVGAVVSRHWQNEAA